MADSSYTQRGPPKRNNDARREQNRRASRSYRQKRKQKLALLDQFMAPDHGQPSVTSSSPDARRCTEGVVGSVAECASQSRAPVSSDAARPDKGHLMSALTNHGWSDLPDLPPDSPGYATGSDERPATFGLDPSLRTETLAPTLLSTAASRASPHTSFGGPTGMIVPGPVPHTEPDADDAAVMDILSGVQSLSLKQKQSLLRQLQRDVNVESDGDGPSYLEPSAESPSITNWVSAYPRPGDVRTKLQSEARRFAAFVDKFASGSVGPAQLTRIFSTEASFFSAVFANCYALGMSDVEPLMIEEGVSIFSLGPDTGYESSQLAIVRPRYDGITPNLRPCDVQLTFGHHPYLDVLPFRQFRDKALHALENDPLVLDEDKLCRDLAAGGLICWGSQQNPTGMEAGVPWDARSWERQIWFLKKYRYLVGGWDDEMWKLARWWHAMRNEKIRP